MSQPKLELTYFDVDRGRGEPARLTMFIGGIEWTDHRLSFAEFGQRRLDFPFARLPVLAVDGVTVSDSAGINRYVGTLAGLYPQDPVQAMRCDEIHGAIEDASAPVLNTMGIADPAEKQAVREALVANELPFALARLQARLGGQEWFVEDRMTVADLRAFVWLRGIASGLLEHIPADLAETCAPELAALRDRVAAQPKVVEYYTARAQARAAN